VTTAPIPLDELHRLIGHYARMLADLQKARIGMRNRIDRFEEYGFQEPQTINAKAAVAGLEQIEHTIDLELRSLVRQHPLAPWIKEQVGIGLDGFARLLGVTGPLDRFPTVSKLWKYLGLHVTPQGTAPKRRKGEAWSHTDCRFNHLRTCKPGCKTDHHPNCVPGGVGTAYAPHGRTLCYLLGESIVKAGKGPYRAAYDEKKAYYEQNRPDWPQIRRHRAAMRYAVKMLIKELWLEWRAVLGTGDQYQAA